MSTTYKCTYADAVTEAEDHAIVVFEAQPEERAAILMLPDDMRTLRGMALSEVFGISMYEAERIVRRAARLVQEGVESRKRYCVEFAKLYGTY